METWGSDLPIGGISQGWIKLLRAILIGFAIAFAGTGFLEAAGQQAASTEPSLSAERELLNRYCVTCHNERLQTAQLTLDTADVENVGANGDLWERVVRKLRARAMPPVGMPRPDEASYSALVEYLETKLDGEAEANPGPGRPSVQRLNRTEYANAVRDLLALEIDAESLLPQDNVGFGFDNVGDVLSVSPLLMERYVLAAERISRLAIGDAAVRPVAEQYEVPDEFLQDSRMSEDLPFGSRGGTAIHHRFPVDGEYVLNVRLHRNQDGYIRGLRKPHRLDVRLDGARIQLFQIGGEIHGRSGPLFSENQNPAFSGDPEQVGYEFNADEILEVRFPAEAGTGLVQVAFLKETVKPVGFLKPPLLLSDISHYKGGDPAVESVTITGPFQAGGLGETPSRNRIFACYPNTLQEEEGCARTILATLARRAYRRPVAEEEIQDLLNLYIAGRRESGNFDRGIEMALQGILAGPEFLFRVEQDPPGTPPGSPYRLSDLELASRLSFFLWSSIPDEELLGLAESGRLQDPAVLERQARRMLADPRSRALVDNFAGQWLHLRNLIQVSPDPELFPDFDGELREAFRTETELLFESMLREDRPALELLEADYTFLNERLARHYGIPGVHGSHFRRVALPDESRRGLLGHGSVLTVTSYENRTSPVLRGKWVMENLLGMPPPPPPPDVPALEVRSQDGQSLTMRQAMEQHRANPVCASCHKLMDPIGFALEPFDAIGRGRTIYTENNDPIDASGTFLDGSDFQNTVEFRKVLLDKPEQLVHTITEKLLTYALGRGVEYTDMPAVRKIVRESAGDNFRWSSLILGIVDSIPFQMRRSQT